MIIRLCNYEHTWSYSVVSHDIIKVSQYLHELLDMNDTLIDDYVEPVEIMVGKTSTPKETIDAISKLRILPQLADSIYRFNNPEEGTSFETLTTWKHEIKGLYKRWNDLPKSAIYNWLFPNNKMTSIVNEFETNETSPARWYQTNYLHETICYCIMIEGLNGNLDIIQWLHSFNDITLLGKYRYREDIFNIACIHSGNLEMAKWLYSLGKFDMYFDDNYVFYSSCQNGHFEIAKWLYSSGKFDIHYNDDIAFYLATRNGYLEIAKWLYSIGGYTKYNYINYNGLVEIFEYIMCVNYTKKNKIKTIQWIYSLGDWSNQIFRRSVEKLIHKVHNPEIAEWLKTLYPHVLS